MHGYQLNQELLQREVRDWAAVSRAQVYYSLKKLQEQGLIAAASEPEPDPSAGPERTTFRILPVGTRALQKALETPKWARQRPPEPFITWLALSPSLQPAQIAKMIAARHSYLSAQLKKERATLAALQRVNGPQVLVGRCMVELGIVSFETELRWLDTLDHKLVQPLTAAKKRRR